jgi:hypothetical protein
MRLATTAALVGTAVALVFSPAIAEDKAAVPGASTPAAAHSAAKGGIKVGGKLRIKIELRVSPSLPDGTPVSISPAASVIDATFANSAGVSGSATVAKGKANLTLDMPYTWNVASTSETVTVSVNASASAANGGVQYFNSSNFSQTFTLPADGSTTTVSFSGSI